MSLLPATLIYPTYTLILTPTLGDAEGVQLTKLKNYVMKNWFTQIPPEKLSIYELNIATNNGAENYRTKLKAKIRTFMSYISEIILDVDKDNGRLRIGREISLARRRMTVKNAVQRAIFIQKLSVGEFTPWQFFASQ